MSLILLDCVICDSNCTNVLVSNFTHLKLWVALAGHNFKFVKIQIILLSAIRSKGLFKIPIQMFMNRDGHKIEQS